MRVKNKTLWLCLLLTLFVVGAVSADSMDVTLSSPASGGTRARTIDVTFTAVTDNATAMTCELNIGTTTQPEDFSVTNNTAKTLTSLTIPDGNHTWNVNCTAGHATNTSSSRWVYVDFATYDEADIGETGIDIIVGVLSAIFSLVTLIGLAILYRYYKGKKKLV